MPFERHPLETEQNTILCVGNHQSEKNFIRSKHPGKGRRIRRFPKRRRRRHRHTPPRREPISGRSRNAGRAWDARTGKNACGVPTDHSWPFLRPGQGRPRSRSLCRIVRQRCPGSAPQPFRRPPGANRPGEKAGVNGTSRAGPTARPGATNRTGRKQARKPDNRCRPPPVAGQAKRTPAAVSAVSISASDRRNRDCRTSFSCPGSKSG